MCVSERERAEREVRLLSFPQNKMVVDDDDDDMLLLTFVAFVIQYVLAFSYRLATSLEKGKKIGRQKTRREGL